MKRYYYLTAMMLLTVTGLQNRTLAGVWIEDFENGFDLRFNHQLTGFDSFETFSFVSPTHSLGLQPGTDSITFDLGSDELISYASVWFMNNCGVSCTTVEFIGTLGSQSFGSTIGFPEWEFVDTTGLELGHIAEIRLSSDQSIFDDISVNVVPEPGTAFLMLTCGWIFLRNPRRSAGRSGYRPTLRL